MNFMFAALGLGGWEMVLILAVVLLLFGARKLPDLAKGLGQGWINRLASPRRAQLEAARPAHMPLGLLGEARRDLAVAGPGHR